jgi:hypothetical protein
MQLSSQSGLTVPAFAGGSARTFGRMKAALSSLDEFNLNRIGDEATRFITSGDFEAMHARFGYAIALGSEPVAAIAQDLD